MQDTAVVIRAMLNFDSYTRHIKALDTIPNLSKEQKRILSAVRLYYSQYPDQKQILVPEMRLFFYEQNPAVNREVYDREFQLLSEAEQITPDLVKDVLLRVLERHACSEIYQIAIDTVQTHSLDGIARIKEVISGYEALKGQGVNPLEEECTLTIEEILKADIKGAIPWSLKFFNEVLGPLLPGRLGHIFSRPDVGKTSLAMFQLGFMVWRANKEKLDQHFLYLNNEESIKVIRSRAYCSLLGWTVEECLANPEEANRIYRKKGGDRLHLFGEVGHMQDVEKYINLIHPAVTVVDQGPKLSIFGKETDEVEKKKRIYNQLRALAIKYNTSIISLGQADHASENRKYLNLGNLDGSKTGIPGELDWCLGMGAIEDAGFERMRYLNVCKNKMTGKHGHGSVVMHKEICRFEDKGGTDK